MGFSVDQYLLSWDFKYPPR